MIVGPTSRAPTSCGCVCARAKLFNASRALGWRFTLGLDVNPAAWLEWTGFVSIPVSVTTSLQIDVVTADRL